MIEVFESHGELMKVLLDGKKLKRVNWGDDAFIRMGDDIVIDQDLDEYEFDFNRYTDWTLA